jgi:L-ascorbate metabolism protein UlaG (beta-lactamase superfamily)
MKEFFTKPSTVNPPAPLPTVKTNLKDLHATDPLLIWFGHSSYLLQVNGKIILVDPVFSGNAAPLRTMIKAFKGADLYTADDLPDIDILLITHDHYDHLDHKLMKKLIPKVKRIVCSLGVGAHMEYWGYDAAIIHELDWEEAYQSDGITLTAAPARHFSGRGVKRGQTLWSSFILTAGKLRVYIGGDSGYDKHFKNIGEKHGPFDLAILECGQYNKSWPHIHMMPEETVAAAQELKARILMPVHWGKFSLAVHPWDEPVERLLKRAQELRVEVATPMIGEAMLIGGTLPQTKWWKQVIA